MKSRVQFDVRPGGGLLLALLYFFGDLQILAVLFGSIVIHELGHAAALRIFGARVRRIRVDVTGLCMDYRGLRLTRRQEFLTAAAGPLAGGLAAWGLSFLGNWYGSAFLLLFAGTGLVLTGFNLIPAKPLDGWRMVAALFPNAAETVSLAAGAVTLFVGLWLMKGGYGPGLAAMGVMLLLYDTVPERRIYSKA